jgi:hypothetical protein
VGVKICINCKQEHPREAFAFSPNSHAPDKLGIICATCRSTLTTREKTRLETAHWRANNVERSRTITYRSGLKRLYGLTQEQYDEALKTHGNRCAICGVSSGGRRLHLDRCGSTTQIRGLLCSGCNTGLGGFRDDQGLLEKAIEYLKKSKQE